MIRPQKLTKRQAMFVLFSSICIISFFAAAMILSEPTITIHGSEHIYLNVGESYVENGATATDNAGNWLPVKVSGNVDSTQPGETEVVYSASYRGRTVEAVRTVTVVELESDQIS